MGDEFVDPYIDPVTGILRNKIGATTYDELRNAEGELAGVRMGELLERLPLRPSGTLDDMRTIHRILFQDIYDWAGEIRKVEIRKSREGSEFFLPSANIAMGIAWAHEELKKDNMLFELGKDAFVERISYHYDNYNFVHPFREGNGRTQRLMWTLLCHDAGYDLLWRDVTGEENDEASRLAAEDRDFEPLMAMFARIAMPCDPRRPINKELMEALEIGHRSEAPEDRA